MCKTPASDTTTQEIEIDFSRIEDAPGIARLFRQVYGTGYPIRTYYLPDRLIEENAAGHIISSVARTPTGEVVGHDALVLLDSAAHLYENAAGAVLPAFRGKGIFPRLFEHSIVSASKRCGAKGIVGEPVCSHIHVQKMCLELDFKESGLEVDLLPASAYAMDPDALGRISVILGCFMHEPGVQTVHMPLVYRDELKYLYAGLKVERTFVYSRSDLPAEGSTHGGMNLFDLAQVARISIDCIGADFNSFIAHLESQAREKGVEVFHVWLPLASQFAPAATDILRGHGYFLGGMLPCFLNGDSLLMQKVSKEPNWESISLYSERAGRIGEMIKRDWKCVTQG
jgi:GNAT superfamily N-acetyltransferase